MKSFRLPVRAVVDVDVVRAGIRSRRRPEFACLQMIADGHVTPLCTPALFLEYEDVLTRKETLDATGLTREDVEAFLSGLAAVIEPVLIDFDWRPLLPDPDDDMIANCAINGRADCVVSNNERHLKPIELRFGIPVLKPGLFIAQLSEQIRTQQNGEE